jgi:plasmid maintenance system antidote protein VapI
MAKRQTLRQYVESFGRTTKQYQIAEALGIREDRLSRLLNGRKPTRPEAEKLKARGIEVAA